MAAAAAMPSIPKELIDQFVTGPMSAQAVNAASRACPEFCVRGVA
jgi:putative transposase